MLREVSGGRLLWTRTNQRHNRQASLFDRLQEMMDHVVCYLFALDESVPTGGAEVSSKPNARIHVFLSRLRETLIGTIHTTRRCAGRDAETKIIRREEVGQNLSRRAANRGVLRIIVRMHANVD